VVTIGPVPRCVAAAILFGASAPAASTIAGDLNPFALAGLLYVGAAIAVLPATIARPPARHALRLGAPRLAVAVIVGGAIAPVLLAAGLARTPAATVSLLLNAELVATVVLAGVLFREHIGRRVGTGAALVLTGSVVLAWSGTPTLQVGALFVIGACLCWAIDNCVTATMDQLAPHHITTAKGVVAGTANLAIGLVLGGLPPTRAALLALAIGSLGYGLSITLWVSGAKELGAARGQLIFAVAPFVGAVIAWVVLGDPVTGAQVVASVLAAVGVLSVMNSGHLHEHRHAEVDHDHAHRHDDDHHDHGHDVAPAASHGHRHRHAAMAHAHPHLPDVHHRHDHD
jgi:drug/metabolite transporter (DMT)-like permease